MKKSFDIRGLDCESCARNIEKVLSKKNGVKTISVSYATNKIHIEYNEKKIDFDFLSKVVSDMGYKIIEGEEDDVKKTDRVILYFTLIFSAFIIIFENFLKWVPNIHWVIFILTTPVQFIAGYKFYKGAFNALKNKTTNMDTLIALGTSTAYFYSLFILLSGGVAEYFGTSAVLIAFVMLGKYLEEKAKGRASRVIKKLMDLSPKKATVIRKKKEFSIPVSEVEVGDIILVKPGEQIPVDGIVKEGHSSVNEAMISGESMPVGKYKGDKVTAATINLYGSLKIEATIIGEGTVFNRIIQYIEETQTKKIPIQRFADRISSYFVPFVIFIAFITFVLWFFSSGDINSSIIRTISVLVIACPCALGLATPTAIIVGVGLGVENKILIRRGEAMEKAHKIDAVVFDKTGTLTRGELEVVNIVPFQGSSEKEVLSYAASLEKFSEHPIAKAIVKKMGDGKLHKVNDFKAYPGLGIKGYINRKPVLVGNETFMIKNNIEIKDFSKIEEIQSKGRTIVLVAVNRKILGVVGISDVPKPSAKKTVKELKKMGLEVYMITGDNSKTAKAIADDVGIDMVISDVMPQDKAKKIKELQNSGISVAMVGDGINDSPALVQSNLGIAMSSGTDITIESGDLILMRDDPEDVIKAIKLSKKTMSKVKQNMFWALFYNSLGIPLAAGVISSIWLTPEIAAGAMALSSISVVLNSLSLRKAKL